MSFANDTILKQDMCTFDEGSKCYCSECTNSYIDKNLNELYSKYESNNSKAVDVNFRHLVSWVPYSDSFTHYIHKYPAKLLKHIPIFFLNSKRYLPNKRSVVLDPFCGSGTVLLESLLAGHNSIGFDANPLARSISRVKNTPVNPIKLYSVATEIIKKAKRLQKAEKLNVVNIDYWFPKHVQYDLSRLKRAIDGIEEANIREFFQISYSAIVKSSSYADPNVSVPVKLKPTKFHESDRRKKAEQTLKKINTLDVFSFFKKISHSNIRRMEKLYSLNDLPKATVLGNDARNLVSETGKPIPDSSIDCILTSPPYAGAQKYIRASSLNLGWLGYCEDKNLRYYEEKNIGREHYHKHEYAQQLYTGFSNIDKKLSWIRKVNPLRSHINGNYLLEMQQSISEMYRVLKPGSYCIIVIANNHVCGEVFETQAFIRDIAIELGFKHELSLVDDITSRGLMTKRNKTANVINNEWVLVFKK